MTHSRDSQHHWQDYEEAFHEAFLEHERNDPEIFFDMKCKMKESILVRALVIPSYLLAVMTSGRWKLPPVFVDSAEENRIWLKSCLLLRHVCMCVQGEIAEENRGEEDHLGGMACVRESEGDSRARPGAEFEG